MKASVDRRRTASRIRHQLAALGLTGVMLGSAAAVWAQPADGGMLEEIIVTARKRAEPVQATPVAVSALSPQELESRGLGDVAQLGGSMPNVNIEAGAANGGGSNSSMIFIRGIGQTDFLATSDPGVGLYIDGIYFPRSVGSVIDLVDLERMEVLRGPQGTLFGKNTIGGAINIVSKAPTGENGGSAQVTLGRFGRADFSGKVDFALIPDTLDARLALVSKNQDGYAKLRDFDIAAGKPGAVLADRGDESKLGLRGSLSWRPSEGLRLSLAGDYSRSREAPAPINLLAYTGGPKPAPALGDLWNGLVGLPSGTPMSSVFISGDPDTTYGTANPVNNLDLWGFGLTVEKEMGAVDLVSITGVRGFEALFGRDGDGTPIDWNQSLNDQTQRQFSQELRLDGASLNDRFKWTAGLFYFHEKNIDRNEVQVVPGLWNALERLPVQLTGAPCAPPFLAPGCAGNPINANLDLRISAYNRVVGDSYAAFGQGSFAVTEALNLTGGMRYSYENKRYTIEHYRRVSGTYIVPLTAVSDHWGSFTPMASIDYTPVPDVMAYASVARGFKSGGFNGRPLDGNGVQSFDPENVTSYEAGIKSEWLDNRLRLNAAAFYSDYTDLQFTANIFSDKVNSLVQVIENAGKARIKGLELEMQARPVPALSLQAAAGYTHFRITELTADVPGVTLNSRQPRTPQFNASAGAAYTVDIGPAELTGRVDWIYEGSSYADIQNTAVLRKPASDRWNARLTYVSGDGDWEVALYGLNLTDERYIVSGLSLLDSFGHAEGTYNRPREWGVSVKRSF